MKIDQYHWSFALTVYLVYADSLFRIPTNLITSTVDDDIDVTMNYKQSANLNSSSVDSNCYQIPCISLLHNTDAGSIELELSNFQNVSFFEIDGIFTNFLGFPKKKVIPSYTASYFSSFY